MLTTFERVFWQNFSSCSRSVDHGHHGRYGHIFSAVTQWRREKVVAGRFVWSTRNMVGLSMVNHWNNNCWFTFADRSRNRNWWTGIHCMIARVVTWHDQHERLNWAAVKAPDDFFYWFLNSWWLFFLIGGLGMFRQCRCAAGKSARVPFVG